jgi:Raf kinase inhibitor-like YbhB/YbcL family protein
MRILELIGNALRPFHSDDSKLTESTIALTDREITMLSPVFAKGSLIPKAFTDDGGKLFPTITWTNIPTGTQSLVLVIEDPDAPKPSPFLHGIIYNIPADFFEVPETAFEKGKLIREYTEAGLRLGSNSLGQQAYMPPAPPPGHGMHHYHFQLMALDTKLTFDKTPTLIDIKASLDGHVLAAGDLVGLYER